MEKVRFNNKEEFKRYYKENHLCGSIVCWSDIEEPTHYPCILVWKEFDDGEEENIYGIYIYQEDLK
jgi:hypothetical protein